MSQTPLRKASAWTVLIALLTLGPVVAGAATEDRSPFAPTSDQTLDTTAIDQQRAELSRRLVEQGADAQTAQQAVAQLTAADVRTLQANPDMIQSAGAMTNQEAIGLAFGVTIVALLLVIAI